MPFVHIEHPAVQENNGGTVVGAVGDVVEFGAQGDTVGGHHRQRLAVHTPERGAVIAQPDSPAMLAAVQEPSRDSSGNEGPGRGGSRRQRLGATHAPPRYTRAIRPPRRVTTA